MNSFKAVDAVQVPAVDATVVADLVTRGDMSLRDAMARATVTRSWGDVDVDTMAASTMATTGTRVPADGLAYGLIVITAYAALVVVFMANFGSMVGAS